MKLFLILYCILAFIACNKEKNDSRVNPNCVKNIIDFRMMDENGNDLLRTGKIPAETDLQVLHLTQGKKELYFNQEATGTLKYGYEIIPSEGNEEEFDSYFLRLHLAIPESLYEPISYTFFRFKGMQEFILKAEFDYLDYKRKKTSPENEEYYLKVIKINLNNESFWQITDTKMPILIVKK